MWVNEVFGVSDTTRDLLAREVEGWDREEGRTLTRQEADARQKAVSNIWKLNKMEEITWRQKFGTLWLKEGDRKTRFFHKMANERSINYIGRLRGETGFWRGRRKSRKKLLLSLRIYIKRTPSRSLS